MSATKEPDPKVLAAFEAMGIRPKTVDELRDSLRNAWAARNALWIENDSSLLIERLETRK